MANGRPGRPFGGIGGCLRVDCSRPQVQDGMCEVHYPLLGRILAGETVEKRVPLLRCRDCQTVIQPYSGGMKRLRCRPCSKANQKAQARKRYLRERKKGHGFSPKVWTKERQAARLARHKANVAKYARIRDDG